MAIIGAILGDIASSQFEMEAMDVRDWANCELYTEKCMFTDDSVRRCIGSGRNIPTAGMAGNSLTGCSEIIRSLTEAVGTVLPCGYHT